MPDRIHKKRGNDPMLSQTNLRGDCRKLEIKNEIWQWKTNGSMVITYSPTNDRQETPGWQILEMDKSEWDTIRSSDESEAMAIPITPKDVSDYINRVFLGRNLEKVG